jgi:hypothetical protein
MPTVTSTQSSSNLAKQLSDGNALGTVLGQSTSDPIGFFQSPAANVQGGVVQPSGNALSTLVRGQAAGIVSTWATLQSPAAVGPNTSGEVGLTVQSGTVTNAALLIASGDVLYINKPTSQAGLGVGNVRVSASNVAGVTFTNWTAATITPTASQGYGIVAIRGLRNISATLTPAAVGPNLTTEQVFTIAPTAASPQGLKVGQLVQVMKPTAQAGIDIVGCRVVANNQIGITFANVTAATVTPTAGESYTILCLGGLDAKNGFMSCMMNAGTVGAIGAGLVITGGNTTFTGITANDLPIGPATQPTAQAAATNATAPIMTIAGTNSLTMYFLSAGSGATPTANLPYTQLIYRFNPAAPLVLYTQALSPTSVAPNTTAEQTFTVTGLVSGSPAWVNMQGSQPGLGIAGVRVSGTNTLAITFTNSTAATITPTAGLNYVIGNFQVPTPGNGNCIYQAADASFDNAADLLGALRAALGPTGVNLHAGA